MLESLVKLSDDATGIEKTLRLFQGFCTIAAGLTWDSVDAAQFAQARSELALGMWTSILLLRRSTNIFSLLGRRYFRLLKWYPCWTNAYRTFNGDTPPLMKLLEVGKLSFLGMYFFLEMPTLTNTMRATNYSWGPTLVLEANKCWFYAIVFSILMSLFQLLTITTQISASPNDDEISPPSPSKEGRTARPQLEATPYSVIFRQLVIDGCDLIIAGSTVTWIDADAVQVGVAYVVSSSVAGQPIWKRVMERS